VEAAKAAINSPLLDVSIEGAKGVLFAIAGDDNMTMFEIQEAAKTIIESIDPNAKVIFGAFHDDKLNKNEIKVTVIASGFPENFRRKPLPGSENTRSMSAEAAGEEIIETKAQKKSEPIGARTIKPVEVEEEEDDWSSIPAFLRRPKK
jgi:cell division protein FtsZ